MKASKVLEEAGLTVDDILELNNYLHKVEVLLHSQARITYYVNSELPWLYSTGGHQHGWGVTFEEARENCRNVRA